MRAHTLICSGVRAHLLALSLGRTQLTLTCAHAPSPASAHCLLRRLAQSLTKRSVVYAHDYGQDYRMPSPADKNAMMLLPSTDAVTLGPSTDSTTLTPPTITLSAAATASIDAGCLMLYAQGERPRDLQTAPSFSPHHAGASLRRPQTLPSLLFLLPLTTALQYAYAAHAHEKLKAVIYTIATVFMSVALSCHKAMASFSCKSLLLLAAIAPAHATEDAFMSVWSNKDAEVKRRLSGTVTSVAPGEDTLQNAIASASAGDILELQDGVFTSSDWDGVGVLKADSCSGGNLCDITTRAQNPG